MPHSYFSQLGDLRRQREQVIKVGRGEITHIHLGDHEQQSAVFDLLVIVANAAQHLDAATLEVVKVVRVVYTTLPIGFLVGNAELNLVFQQGGGVAQRSIPKLDGSVRLTKR